MVLADNSNQSNKWQVWVMMRSGIPRAMALALIWWIITEGNVASWFVGIPVIVASTVTSMIFIRTVSSKLCIVGIVRFLFFFLIQSIIGGVDVARRAFYLRVPLSPFLFNYSFRLAPGISRVFMANTISLLPGTLSAELHDDSVTVHGIDETINLEVKLQILEEHVAYLFGQRL